MSFKRLKQLVPSAFADNRVDTMIAETNKAVGYTLPEIPPLDWAVLAVMEIEKRRGIEKIDRFRKYAPGDDQ